MHVTIQQSLCYVQVFPASKEEIVVVNSFVLTRSCWRIHSPSEKLKRHVDREERRCLSRAKEARMSLKPEPFSAIPEPPARLARIVCPKGGVCIWIGDELRAVFQDELFASFFPRQGQPAEAPWRLALVTVLQFVGRTLG